jgi:hypothetical protein
LCFGKVGCHVGGIRAGPHKGICGAV